MLKPQNPIADGGVTASPYDMCDSLYYFCSMKTAFQVLNVHASSCLSSSRFLSAFTLNPDFIPWRCQRVWPVVFGVSKIPYDARMERPRKRIRQACEPCRYVHRLMLTSALQTDILSSRKKAKCLGERPSCSLCRRLDQECTYAPHRGRADLPPRPSANSTPSRPTLVQRDDETLVTVSLVYLAPSLNAVVGFVLIVPSRKKDLTTSSTKLHR